MKAVTLPPNYAHTFKQFVFSVKILLSQAHLPYPSQTQALQVEVISALCKMLMNDKTHLTVQHTKTTGGGGEQNKTKLPQTRYTECNLNLR